MASFSVEQLRTPAEWEKHNCTWIAWPHNYSTFPPKIMERVEEVFCEVVYELTRGEVVKILVPSEYVAEKVWRLLGEVGVSGSSVQLLAVKTLDVWVRDYAPIFVEGGGALYGVKWRFNAWGGKYPELAADDDAGREMLRLSGAIPITRPYVVEGGAIEASGDGIVLATRSCLLSPSRNPGVSEEHFAEEFRRFLGARMVVWLERGLTGDDTDGHVDVFCRFISPRTVVLAEDGRTEDDRLALEDAEAKLSLIGDTLPEGLEIERLPLPPPIRVLDLDIPATYLNFYIGNSVVLVPTFGVEEDEEALATLSGLIRDRRVVGVRCPELFYGLGGIHCITVQQPETYR